MWACLLFAVSIRTDARSKKDYLTDAAHGKKLIVQIKVGLHHPFSLWQDLWCLLFQTDLSNGVRLLLIEILSFLIMFEISLCVEVTLHYKNLTLIAIHVRAEINF